MQSCSPLCHRLWNSLQLLPGLPTVYKSKNHDAMKYLRAIAAPNMLSLKKDILIKALKRWINKWLTRVSWIYKWGECTRFLSLHRIHTINTRTFYAQRPRSSEIRVSRTYISFKLVYGLTILKAQRLSLGAVDIICDGIKYPGQMGVALGRATSSRNIDTKDMIQEHSSKWKLWLILEFRQFYM